MASSRLPPARGPRAAARTARLGDASRSPHRPRKRFGQHFLRDRRVIERIVAAIRPATSDCIVEVGPGTGALTARLAGLVGHLHVIEIDRDLAAQLREEYDSQRVTVHEGDALETDLNTFPEPVRIVGNLPYNVSTPLLFHFLLQAARIGDMHFMLQEEVVQRIVAAPSCAEYGRLSVMVQHRCEAVRLFGVPARAFAPPPRVESAFIRLTPRRPEELEGIDETRMGLIVTTAFSHRRKTLRNALASVINVDDIEDAGIDPGLRPENLSFADYRRLAHLGRLPRSRGPGF